MNVADLIMRQAQLLPAVPAIVESDRTLSYQELASLVAGAAGRLAALGLGERDRIGICLKDRAEFLVLFLAAARAGAVIIPMDWRLGPHARARLAIGFGAALVLREPDMPDIAGIPCLSIDALLHDAPAAAPSIESVPGGDRLLAVLPSSGTTGLPRGMVVTHDQYIARLNSATGISLRAPNARYLSSGALVFANNLTCCLVSLCVGNTVILYPPLFSPEELAAAVNHYRADAMSLVPTLVRRLTELTPPAGVLFPGLCCLLVRGAMLHSDEKRTIVRRLTPNLYDRFGTAGTGGISCLLPSEISRFGHSVGRVIPGMIVEVVDGDDRLVRVGKVGRLRCRGPTVISNWLGAVSEGEPEFLREGWYYTSDLVSFDTEGYLYLEGRASETINRGGATIHAAEIEGVLLDHPAVREAAVVGYPGGDLGEEIGAVVVLRDHTDPSQLIGHCRDRLGPGKAPRRIIVCADLPKTSSGKIRKSELASLLQTH